MHKNQGGLVRRAVNRAAEVHYDVMQSAPDTVNKESLWRRVRDVGIIINIRSEEVEEIEHLQEEYNEVPIWQRLFHWRMLHAPVDKWRRLLQSARLNIDEARQRLGISPKEWTDV